MKALEKSKNKSMGLSHSASGTAGKAALLMGVGALAVPAVSAIMPGGLLIWAAIFIIAGIVFAE